MIWIIDPGHEGMSPDNLYLRDGKQSPQVPPGIYEGEFNHDIAHRVCTALTAVGIKNVNLSPGPVNVQLGGEYGRVAYVNRLDWETDTPCRLISIHSNADGSGGWTDAQGMTTFVSPRGSQTSRDMAENLQSMLYVCLGMKDRGVRESAFSIIDDTSCPACLLEIGFMTNRAEAGFLALETTREDVAGVLMDYILSEEE